MLLQCSFPKAKPLKLDLDHQFQQALFILQILEFRMVRVRVMWCFGPHLHPSDLLLAGNNFLGFQLDLPEVMLNGSDLDLRVVQLIDIGYHMFIIINLL